MYFVSSTLSPIKKNEKKQNIFLRIFLQAIYFLFYAGFSQFSDELKIKTQPWQVLPPHSFECARSCAIVASKSASGSQFSST